MATQNDIPVRVSGSLYRLITNGDKAALFDKNGKARTLTVSGSDRRGAPELVTDTGDSVKFTRATRPCSCKGFPWKGSYKSLADQL